MKRQLQTLAPLLVLALATAGCRHRDPSSADAKAAHLAEVETEREQIEGIPPPAKSRYMAIHSLESWQNPYITIQPDMLAVHVLVADANPEPWGAGGMLRPTGARRQDLNVSFDKLGEAMAAIPHDAWPYGRVIALEEAHNTPATQEPVIRRNMESTIATLNDLGIAVFDLNEGKLQ